MKTVEKLRGLTFTHPVVSKTITRAELPKVLRAQMEKSLPYSPDDYALVLRALQLVDAGKTDLVGSMLDLYESQVLAFYDPLTHTYFAHRQAAIRGRRHRRQRHAPRIRRHPRTDARDCRTSDSAPAPAISRCRKTPTAASRSTRCSKAKRRWS